MTTAITARDFDTVTLGADLEIGAGLMLGADDGFSVDGQRGIGAPQFDMQVGGEF